MKSAETTAGIAAIRRTLQKANTAFERGIYHPDFPDSDDGSAYFVELAFMELLLLVERLELPHFYSRVAEMFEAAKGNLGTSQMGEDEPYLVWVAKIHLVLNALETIILQTPRLNPSSEPLLSFLGESLYAITDKDCFALPPASENDVHLRIEMALRCAYPDLLHKPALAKAIKNFIPDTGIPSVRTLIEYKFVGSDMDAKRVADEILTDTRAYEDPAWFQFIFVIYETKRFRSHRQWEDLLRQCGTADKADVVVLCGESPTKNKRKMPNSMKRQAR